MIERTIYREIIKTIKNKAVTVITGARQVGKTTLCGLIEKDLGFGYVSLADPLVRNAAKNDPAEFLSLHPAPYIIDEIHIYFDDSKSVNPSPGYNFRLQIYSIENEKEYELESSKYYYDHNWKLLTKTYGKTKSSAKNKDLKDKYYNDEEAQAEDVIKKEVIKELNYLDNQSNVIKINFKKWNNEFMAHYICFELSINDGTKEVNQIPNILIFPVLIGHPAPANILSIEQYDKFYNLFSIYKKIVHNRIQEINYSEPNYDKKRLLIE